MRLLLPQGPAPGRAPRAATGNRGPNRGGPRGVRWPPSGQPAQVPQPGYARVAASLPYQGDRRWPRQPAEWTSRSVRCPTDSVLAHHPRRPGCTWLYFPHRRETCSAEDPPGKACVRSAAIQRCEGSGPARRGGDAHRNACRAWGGSAVLVRSRPGEKNAGASGACLPNAPSLSKMLTPFFSGAFGSQDAPPCPLNPVLGPAPLPATPEGGAGHPSEVPGSSWAEVQQRGICAYIVPSILAAAPPLPMLNPAQSLAAAICHRPPMTSCP